ncbi:antibiotic biosynthesis monooxygenase family protein [Nitratireductor pacificus]|uniref:ABM domain-containing protein n=1 Tax=Nitratireductor pacificus pht-3B TaxID=391937 RepID=K2M8H1_9HYPH|nr:antibiotic biosynthesis monooxygenase [Nitratireductor pacificus]EKF17260.1 hypothetical protein NA2_19071 [Nitratireductor pacificus pht-3B]
MPSAASQNPSSPHYRVDKFVVPAAARDEFLGRVVATHATLRTQPGFLRDVILEQVSGPGSFNFVTMVEWESEADVVQASEAVLAMHAQTGFDRHEMITRLGIRPDIANYRALVV